MKPRSVPPLRGFSCYSTLAAVLGSSFIMAALSASALEEDVSFCFLNLRRLI